MINNQNLAVLSEKVAHLESAVSASTSASGISYDNTDSGLTADDVQGAIDELAEASGISYDNTDSGLTADNVQGAIDEVNGKNTYQPGETVNIDFAFAMGISNAGGSSLSSMLYLPKEVAAAVSNISASSINLLWVRGGTVSNAAIDKINLHRPNIAELIITGTFEATKMYTASISGSFTLPSA